jgi:hypothetical protein
MYFIRRFYTAFIDKRWLYQNEILTLEDTSPQDYPPRLIEQVRICVETMPKFLSNTREKLNTGIIN